MADVTVRANGPYLLPSEGLKILTQGGKEIPLPEGKMVAFCRCGHSASKPFCDGSHRDAAFTHDPDA